MSPECGLIMFLFLLYIGPKLHANAEADSDKLVDPPKIEDKLGAVPHGLSTDSDVAKRFAYPFFCMISSIPNSFMWCLKAWHPSIDFTT